MSDQDIQANIARYNDLVRDYHDLKEQIGKLIDDNGGGTEFMPDDVIEQYRQLAQKRDDTASEMRSLEQILFTDE